MHRDNDGLRVKLPALVVREMRQIVVERSDIAVSTEGVPAGTKLPWSTRKWGGYGAHTRARQFATTGCARYKVSTMRCGVAARTRAYAVKTGNNQAV